MKTIITSFGQFSGLEGVKRKNIPGSLCKHTSKIPAIIAKRWCATYADDNGCFNIWRDDSGVLRGERQRFFITQERKTFPNLKTAIKWAKKQLTLIK